MNARCSRIVVAGRPVLLMGCLAALTACGTHRNFVELETGDHSFGDVWSGINRVASTDGFRLDEANSDRGRGVYQTRWDMRVLGLGRSGRRRLHCEIVDNPDAEAQLMVRFYVEQQQVQDLGISSPREKDWSDSGEDTVYQSVFVERLARLLGLLDEPTIQAPSRFDRNGQ